MKPEEAIKIIEVARAECEWNAPLEYQEAFKMAIESLKAQPETSTEIQEILNYLDTTLHPIVSPDNWYVYAELHDMVSMLPSAQPEQRWIPCSERLPEDDEIVLVSDGIDYAVAFWRSDAHAWDDPIYGWLDSFGFNVRAWMPLPEPYTERREE